MNQIRPKFEIVPPAAEVKDAVFSEPQMAADFSFGEKVAAVFDDMLDRSIPFYDEIQRMIAEMAAECVVDGTNVYDLGCATGNTLVRLHTAVPKGVRFVGVDYSEEMLKRCRAKMAAGAAGRDHELICGDLNQGVRITNASMVLMVVRPCNSSVRSTAIRWSKRSFRD